MELQELAQRIRRGDREALKTLISEYGVGVYQKAYKKTQDKALAREATRQTFAQLVTSLQEQTDMDGWELWLNALAKRNIETYSNIGSDMAYLESQLNNELFSGDTAERITPPVSDAARLFASEQQQEAQLRQRKQLEAQQAQMLAAQYAAQQQALLQQQQYEAAQAQLQQQYATKLFEQQQQYEALLQRQYEANQQHSPETPQAEESAADAQPQPLPPNERLEGQKTSAHKPRARSVGKDERLFPKKRRAIAPVIIALVLLCILLVWLVVGVVMSLGWLPKLDLGYEWFNANIIELF